MVSEYSRRKNSCSIRDVAEYAGVSAGTVSRILNKSKGVRISAETSKKVMAAAKELNYTPNINAKRLFSRRTHIIALVVPSYSKMGKHIFEDNHLTRIISGLERGLLTREYNILLTFNDELFEQKKRYLEMFRSSNIDGMIIWGAYEKEYYWEDLVKGKFPYLFLINAPEIGMQVNFIKNDCEQAGYVITEHMLSKEYDRLIWLRGKSGISLTCEQEHGILKALLKKNMSLNDIEVIDGDFTSECGYATAEKIFRRKNANHRIGVISANMEMALGLKQYASQRDIVVPEQLGIGCCNSLWNQSGEGRDFTRVRIDDLALGECASNSIIRLIENPALLIQHCYGIEFVEGKTT